ncbi:MAG: HAD family hydrolase [Candidatus Bathyarchaeota archaeon]|nr:HAD family hydrolase [Candidatus Bathyarchaeota archaeon]
MAEVRFKAKGIFLDLDGTIVDSRDAYFEAAKIAFQAMGFEQPTLITALEIPRRLEQSQPISDVIKKVDPSRFLPIYLNAYYSISAEKTKLIPGVAATLETLSKKAKLALITMRNVPRSAIVAELEHWGIAQYFTYVLTAQDTHRPKPSPEALIKAVKALDIQMCDCVMIGDSVSDVRAGKAAGTKTIAVLSGLFTCEELAREKPDLILEDVSKVLGYIL